MKNLRHSRIEGPSERRQFKMTRRLRHLALALGVAGGALGFGLAPLSSAASASASSCPSGYLCLFQDANFGGRMLQFHDGGYWQNLTNYGFNDQMSSWVN